MNAFDQPRDNQHRACKRESIREAARQVVRRIDELAECSDEPNYLVRTFCSDAMRRAHQLVRRWMAAAGMSVRLDPLGNLVARHPPESGSNAVFMIGSHLDTVIDAGKFDGSLGVLLGLAAVELLREGNSQLPFALDVVGFSEEEGVRFHAPFLGSRAIAGVF